MLNPITLQIMMSSSSSYLYEGVGGSAGRPCNNRYGFVCEYYACPLSE